MATTIEVQAGEFVARKRVTSRAAGSFRDHRTLFAGILYMIAIIVVLAAVARL
jgi:hypothetical protein